MLADIACVTLGAGGFTVHLLTERGAPREQHRLLPHENRVTTGREAPNAVMD